MELFTTLTFNGSGIEWLIQKQEAELNLYQLNSHIDKCKGIVYMLEDKIKAKSCSLCSKVIDTKQFWEEYYHGEDQYYCACANLTSKEKNKIKSEQRKHRLSKLKKTKKTEEERRKEERQRQLLDNDKLYRAEQELYRYEYFHEHGVYPKPTKSDNNIIYVWQYDNMYKIGITSKRRGTSRIYEVAKAGNMRANILHYIEVDDAFLVEKELLVYGEQVCFDRNFDGCTEFRYLSNENLEDITYIVNTHAKLY